MSRRSSTGKSAGGPRCSAGSDRTEPPRRLLVRVRPAAQISPISWYSTPANRSQERVRRRQDRPINRTPRPGSLGLGAVVRGFDVDDQVESTVALLVDDASFPPDGARCLADVVHGYAGSVSGSVRQRSRAVTSRRGSSIGSGGGLPYARAPVHRLETRPAYRMAGEPPVLRFTTPTVDTQKRRRV